MGKYLGAEGFAASGRPTEQQARARSEAMRAESLFVSEFVEKGDKEMLVLAIEYKIGGAAIRLDGLDNREFVSRSRGTTMEPPCAGALVWYLLADSCRGRLAMSTKFGPTLPANVGPTPAVVFA